MKKETKRAVKALAALGATWRDDAEATLLELQAELRRKAAAKELTSQELIGAIRALAEALTTNRALLPDPPKDEARAAAAAEVDPS